MAIMTCWAQVRPKRSRGRRVSPSWRGWGRTRQHRRASGHGAWRVGDERSGLLRRRGFGSRGRAAPGPVAWCHSNGSRREGRAVESERRESISGRGQDGRHRRIWTHRQSHRTQAAWVRLPCACKCALLLREHGVGAAIDGGVLVADLEMMQARAHAIVIHAPLTPATHHLIDDMFIARLQLSPVIVNVSRGAVIDNEALVRGLEDGRIEGAGLDVVEGEPAPPRFVTARDTSVATPPLRSLPMPRSRS